MGSDHTVANGISDLADAVQFCRHRSTSQAVLQPTPPEQQMSYEGHQGLKIQWCRQGLLPHSV